MPLKRPLIRGASSAAPRGTTLRSDDGVIAFTLASTAQGVFVERVQRRPGAARVVQSTLFTDDRSFNRWCDADSVRFDYPMVYVNLKRDGDALFGYSGQGSNTA